MLFCTRCFIQRLLVSPTQPLDVAVLGTLFRLNRPAASLIPHWLCLSCRLGWLSFQDRYWGHLTLTPTPLTSINIFPFNVFELYFDWYIEVSPFGGNPSFHHCCKFGVIVRVYHCDSDRGLPLVVRRSGRVDANDDAFGVNVFVLGWYWHMLVLSPLDWA